MNETQEQKRGTELGVGVNALVRRMLRVEASHFVAGATWELGPCGWRCIAKDTAPILRWMAGKSGETVFRWLKHKGYEYSWSRQFDA